MLGGINRKKEIILALLFVIISQITLYAAKMDYAFQRGKAVCYHIYKTNKTVSINNAYQPVLSPDGTKLAYRSISPSNYRISQIVLFDINCGKSTILKTKTFANHSPQWITDGKFLAFSTILEDSIFSISIFDSTGFVKSVFPKIKSALLCDFKWIENEDKLSLYSLDSLWIVNLSGEILNSFDIRKLVKDCWIISPYTILISENKQFMYFNAYNKNASCEITPDGPDAIFRFSFQSDKLEKLTSDDLALRGDFVIVNGIVYASGFLNCDKNKPIIYKIEKKKHRVIIENGYDISVANLNEL